MKNRKVQILEFSFCWPLSVELISKTIYIRERGNPLTYKWKVSAQLIQRKNWIKIEWKKNLVNGHKYSSLSILCYIFHIKPHFSKKLL
jgi:hypothetical protein